MIGQKLNHAVYWLMLGLGLLLSGCGGSSSSTSAASGGGSTQVATVSLTGVVVKAASTNKSRVIGARNLRAAAGVYPKAMVLGIDKDGNTETTLADNNGAFALSLPKGKSYAIVFFDSSLNILGSLVKNTGGANAGVSANGDADLGDVAIDRRAGKAVSATEKAGKLTLDASPVKDADGDGKITMADATAAKSNALVANASAVTTVNTLAAFGTTGVWHVVEQSQGNSMQGKYVQRVISVLGNEKRVSPSGTRIDATKDSRVVYYQSFTDAAGNVQQGYFGNTNGWAEYKTAGSSNPPLAYDVFNGPLAQAQYTVSDPYTNYVYQDSGMGWRKTVPLDVTLGQTYSSVSGNETTAVTVNFAKDSAGKPYLFNDTLGVTAGVSKLPVMDVTVLVKDTYGATFNDHFYVVLNYGVQLPAEDANGTVIPVAKAISSQPFGLVDQYGAIQIANAGAVSDLSKPVQDKWIKYVYDNQAKVGAIAAASTAGNMPAGGATGGTGGATAAGAGTVVVAAVAASDYYFLDWAKGAVVSPSSWNTITYLTNVLTAGQSQKFDTSISYFSTNGSNYKYEFRAWDPVTMQASLLGTSASAVMPMKATAGTAAVSGVVSGVINVPAITDFPAASVWSYLDPATNKTTSGAWVELWLMATDATGATIAGTDQLVESYEVQDAGQFTAVAGGVSTASVQMDWTGTAITPSSWNPVTFMSTYLTAGATAQSFSASVLYDTTDPSTTLSYEFRAWDWATNGYATVGTASVKTGVAATAAPTSLLLTANVDIPLMSVIPADAQWSYFDPAMNTNITEAWLELWVVMRDNAGLEMASSMLEGYSIRDIAAPAASTPVAGVATAAWGYFYNMPNPNGLMVSPAAWDAYTYMPLVLTPSAVQTFTADVMYQSNAAVTLSYEFRALDNLGKSSVVVGAASAGVAQPSANIDTFTVLMDSVTVPDFTQIPKAAQWSYQDPTLGQVTDAYLDLYLVMRDSYSNVLSETYLDNYNIRQSLTATAAVAGGIGYAWVNPDAVTWANVTPASYDAVTYMPKPLTAGANTAFTTNLTYFSTAGVNVRFEFRGWDSTWMNNVVVGSPISIIPPLGATTVEKTQNVLVIVAVPTLTAIQTTAPGSISTYTDSQTGLQVTDRWLELYMVVEEGTAPNTTLLADIALDYYQIK